MVSSQYEKVCYRTQQQDEHVPVRNIRTGEIGYSYLCTEAGTTIQVRLENGELDSWEKDDCVPVGDETASSGRGAAAGEWDKNDLFQRPVRKEEIRECTSERHNMHMCELKKAGDLETMRSLSADPMVKCGKCGALAANPENLCEPSQFPDVTDVGDTFEVK